MVSWLWKGGSADEENEEELKKKGFDPQNLEVGIAAEEAITDFSKDYEGWISPDRAELRQLLLNYKYARPDAGFSRMSKSRDTNWRTRRADAAVETNHRWAKSGRSARR